VIDGDWFARRDGDGVRPSLLPCRSAIQSPRRFGDSRGGVPRFCVSSEFAVRANSRVAEFRTQTRTEKPNAPKSAVELQCIALWSAHDARSRGFISEVFLDRCIMMTMTSECLSRLSLVRPPTTTVSEQSILSGYSDDDLMLMARGGNEAAFDALVRRHEVRVLAVARRLLGKRAELTPDVAQNTFIKIYHSLSRYQPRGTFAAYLSKVLLNEYRMALRGARGESSALESISQVQPEDAASPEAEILARERQRQMELDLDRALGQLSKTLREVVVLRYTGGLTYDQIATVLAVPLGTVGRRRSDAMKKLRELLGEA
jgi:RNA polymerase sigma-70 factor (ECF subfamily)